MLGIDEWSRRYDMVVRKCTSVDSQKGAFYMQDLLIISMELKYFLFDELTKENKKMIFIDFSKGF